MTGFQQDLFADLLMCWNESKRQPGVARFHGHPMDARFAFPRNLPFFITDDQANIGKRRFRGLAWVL